MPVYGLWTNSGFRGSFITTHVAGKLDIEVPSNLHLIFSKVLHHTNHSTVARFVNEGRKVSWPTRVHEVKGKDIPVTGHGGP
jgi:hypothetical protein